MKRCIGFTKPHRAVFSILHDAEEVIHKRIAWNWEIIKKCGPKIRPKLWKIQDLMQRCIRSSKPHRNVFRFLQDITMLKKWFISAFPEIEKISQTLAPKLCQKWWKIEHLKKRFIGSAKPLGTVFRFFARYYDAEEVIHKRTSWNCEDIPNSGPKAMPKMMKNWTFKGKVHRIRKTSWSRFSLFCQILRCWISDS